MKKETREYLLGLAKLLDETKRIRNSIDDPEGIRYIIMSDIVAKEISTKLKSIYLYGE